MNFEQIRILESLLLPPTGLILFALLGALFSFTRGGRQLAFFSVLFLYLLSTPFISSWMNNRLERQFPAVNPSLITNSATPPDALAILGGGYYGESVEYEETTIGPFFAQRIRYAAWLSKRTRLPIIVSSGKSDAPAAARILIEEYGIKNVLVEDSSWTTEDNVSNLKKVMERKGFKKLGVITHGWHMPRSIWSFEAHQIAVMAIPMGLLEYRPSFNSYESWIPSVTSLRRSKNAMHEFTGLLWYQIKSLRGSGEEFDLTFGLLSKSGDGHQSDEEVSQPVVTVKSVPKDDPNDDTGSLSHSGTTIVTTPSDPASNRPINPD